MPAQLHPVPGQVESISPTEIAEVIDTLANRINADGDADLFGGWAVARLASRLDLTVAISAATEPVDVVRDIGDALVAQFAQGLDGMDPAGVPDVLRAAHRVIQKVVQAVRERGLAA